MTRQYGVLLIALMAASCGGGGGGGGTSQTPDTNPFDPVDGSDLNPIAGNFGCAVTLDQAFLDNLDMMGSESLDNLSTGCDYFAPESISLAQIATVQAGVTVALGESVNLEFNNESIELLGTADSPIVFQAKDASKPWESIKFDASSFLIDFALFTGGGQAQSTASAYSPETYTEAAVYIDFSGAGISSGSVTNSSFTDSASAGVLLGDRVELDSFSTNHFESNNSYSMVLETYSSGNIINESANLSFAGATEQPILINFEKFRGRFGDHLQFGAVGIPYIFANLVQGRTLNNADLLFKPGVEVWFDQDSGLSGNTLFVLGEADSPVVFKGLPGNEDKWAGISVDGESVMRHFEIIGGGLGQETDGSSLYLQGSSGFNRPLISDAFRIEHGSIENSQGVGLKCDPNGSVYTANLSNVSIENAAFGLIDPVCGVTANQIAPTAESEIQAINAYSEYDVHAGECANVIFDERIETPLTLENGPAVCDYLFVGDSEFSSNVTIEAGATLIFERAASLEVDVIRAIGTEDEPIVFRGNSATPGYWNGLSVTGNGSNLSYVTVLDAGATEGRYSISTASDDGIERQLSNAVNLRAHAIEFTGLSTSMTNSTINRSAGSGLFTGANATFTELSENSISNVGGFAAFVSPENVLVLAEGVEIDPTQPSFVSNGVYVSDREFFSSYREIRSNFFSNIAEYVRVDGELRLLDIGVPWVFPSLELSGSMIVEPGVDLRMFYNLELTDSAASLAINGTALEPVSVSGLKDDPDNKLWFGIDVRSGSVSIENANLQGADVGLFLYTNGGDVTITSTTITDGRSGISCSSFFGGQLSLTNTDITNMSEQNIGADCP